MKRIKLILLISLFPVLIFAQDMWTTPFETSEGMRTATYDDMIEYSLRLSDASPQVTYQLMGVSAGGYDIPIIIINKTGLSTPD